MKTLRTPLARFVAFAALATLAVSGCKRHEADTDEVETATAMDNNTAEASFDDVNKIVDEVVRTNASSTKTGTAYEALETMSRCATVTVDSTDGFPRTFIVDFGAANCLCNDGRYRRGKLTFMLTAPYKQTGSIITVSPTDFHINDKLIEFSKTITNNGLNSANHLTWTVQVTNGRITWPDGTVATRNHTRVREMVAGQSTPTLSDDAYDITGTASGVNRKGNAFTATITTALHVQAGCHYIQSGVVQHTVLNKTYTVDFGNGNCDDQATVSRNGRTRTITL